MNTASGKFDTYIPKHNGFLLAESTVYITELLAILAVMLYAHRCTGIVAPFVIDPIYAIITRMIYRTNTRCWI